MAERKTKTVINKIRMPAAARRGGYEVPEEIQSVSKEAIDPYSELEQDTGEPYSDIPGIEEADIGGPEMLLGAPQMLKSGAGVLKRGASVVMKKAAPALERSVISKMEMPEVTSVSKVKIPKTVEQEIPKEESLEDIKKLIENYEKEHGPIPLSLTDEELDEIIKNPDVLRAPTDNLIPRLEKSSTKTPALSKMQDKVPLPKTDLGNESAKELANKYVKTAKIKPDVPKPFIEINKDFASKVAKAYEDMPHNPDSPEVQKAYKALIDETVNQFNFLKKNGLKISRIEPGMENPYKSSKDLFKDLKENNHMWYYPTESGFGSEMVTTSHPLLVNTGITDKGKPLVANDIFRIVHDYFGHVKEGTSFGPKGEEMAYRIHKSMYSPDAQKALATETRGQNSWVNFGPHGEANRANPKNTIYAEQKAGLLPDWATKDYD